MRPTSYRGLGKSHKNILEWLKIAFPPPKNRTMRRENTSTPFWGEWESWGQSQGGDRDPPAPAPRRSPPLLSQARTLCQKHDAVLYQTPFLARTESDQPWVLSQNDFFGRKFHIWEGKDEAFKKVSLPAKKGSYRNKGEENISWVTEFCPALPEGTNSYIVFHKLTQLLQQAETLGSTSKTDHEPLRQPAVPLRVLSSPAATFAEVQRAIEHCQNVFLIQKSRSFFFSSFFSFFLKSTCCCRGPSTAPCHQFKKQREDLGEWANSPAWLGRAFGSRTQRLAPKGDLDPLLQKDGL